MCGARMREYLACAQGHWSGRRARTCRAVGDASSMQTLTCSLHAAGTSWRQGEQRSSSSRCTFRAGLELQDAHVDHVALDCQARRTVEFHAGSQLPGRQRRNHHHHWCASVPPQRLQEAAQAAAAARLAAAILASLCRQWGQAGRADKQEGGSVLWRALQRRCISVFV